MDEIDASAEEPDAWSFEHPDTVAMFSDQRLTVSMILEEENIPPPVMFSSKKSLTLWACKHDLCRDNLKNHDEDSVLRIHGNYHTTKGFCFRYDHVWVCVKYGEYRRAQNDAVDLVYSVAGVDTSNLDEEPPEDDTDTVLPSEALKVYKVDADHVINKGSLKALQTEAWVLLFPVPRNANRGFGAKFEKYYPSVSAATDRLDLPPEVAFKIFCGAMPKTKQQFARAMGKVRGQFDLERDVIKKFVAAMEKSLAPHFTKS